jgi:hypothetical protein
VFEIFLEALCNKAHPGHPAILFFFFAFRGSVLSVSSVVNFFFFFFPTPRGLRELLLASFQKMP